MARSTTPVKCRSMSSSGCWGRALVWRLCACFKCSGHRAADCGDDRAAHEAGAKVLIDAASVGGRIRRSMCRRWIAISWFFRPQAVWADGIGVLYGKEELLDAMPPYQGGGT